MIKAIGSVAGRINAKQSINGKVNNAVIEMQPSYEELTIVPTAETVTKVGSYNKVTVTGDADLIPENIAKGKSIFGVEGTAGTSDVCITDARYMFYFGARLDQFDALLSLFDKVTNVSNMCVFATTATELDFSPHPNAFGLISTTSSCFSNCMTLKKLNISEWDLSATAIFNSTFNMCSALEELVFGKLYGKGFTQKTANNSAYTIDLSATTRLSRESILDLFNKVYDLNETYQVATGGRLYTQQIKLGTTNIAKLSAEDLSIATNKGWNIA